MDDPHKNSPDPAEIKNALPDVVHSPQIATLDENAATELSQTDKEVKEARTITTEDAEDISETESISEHLPSKVEESLSESEKLPRTQESKEFLKFDTGQDKLSNSLNIPVTHSPASDNPSTHGHTKQSSSWPIDITAASDNHHISEESPVNLALSSDYSKNLPSQGDEFQHSPHIPHTSQIESEGSHKSDKYVDSLNEESVKSLESDGDKMELSNDSEKEDLQFSKDSSGSEEIIKLDIRGQGAPKFPLPTAKIIFGPPPQGGTILDPNIEPIPVFPNLLSPFLVSGRDNIQVEEVFDFTEQEFRDPSLERSGELLPEKSNEVSLEKQNLSSDKSEQQDLLVEEMIVEDVKGICEDKLDEPSLTQPKSMAPEETLSFSTMTTDYKTICEEYHAKLVHFEDALTKRDELIEALNISLQRSVRERDELKLENDHLIGEVEHLQHVVGERSCSDHDTVKAQLSDFMKYQTMTKDDSTKFYSALMSGGSSLRSSNGEKDMDHEEITVNYSKSDLKSSECSDEFQTGFESKISSVINKFDECIEENLRNKLRESIIQVLCDEISKMRLESDTDIKELETQMQQDKQAYTIETRRLRELLASVKAGNADIDTLREELSIKHEKEMENLRTYFEKKCTDMERSYSEEVWRGRVCASPAGSASSLEAPDAAGDYIRRRTRSAELPSLSLESTPLEQAMKQTCKKYEQQIEELKAEHVAYVSELQAKHAEAISGLDEQITQLKAHIQTSENTDANVSLYQQDIDLELEKDARFLKRVDQVRQEVFEQLQEQLQVLLSDPDAEVSSWPLELVALRDKIHGDGKHQQEKELSSLRDELSGSEDKWKQRRNVSFDQNRHLEEVTKERDGLRRVAVSLHRVVGQLVAYCACADDELNRTVLAGLLPGLLSDQTFAEESGPSSANVSAELDCSAVSRGKHVHFAPDLSSVLSALDADGVGAFLQQQRDLSADIKAELEHSLLRLRQEAADLLDLSTRLANKRHDTKMLESSQLHITELVEDLDTKRNCDNCELHRKNMEEAMAECLQRESLLRADLDAAMMRIARLMTAADDGQHTDLIAEGYGTGQSGPRPRVRPGTATVSLGDMPSPRHSQDLEQLQKERDDLQQQLEAANRQLRSTRQFVEEQANEREHERDEYARTIDHLRADNARLGARLHTTHTVLAEVEQLEIQTREMSQMISELESRKASTDDELKASEEKITLLRDIIANLESQLEQKTKHESEVLQELETMRQTIDERDSKMRALLGELEELRGERERSEVVCEKCQLDEENCNDLLERIRQQCRWVEERVEERTRRLEAAHEECSAAGSERSEDVSLTEQRLQQSFSPPGALTPRADSLRELSGVWERLQALARASDGALKRLADLEMTRAQLTTVAQEVRAERDVLQARMSEQALKISSLGARLAQQRHDADALAQAAAATLSVDLHDARAEVQKLKEDLESKDKQISRLKQSLEEKDKFNEQNQTLYGNSCNPKDKVVILERELCAAQARIAQLEGSVRDLHHDRHLLQRTLAATDGQLQDLLALKLDDDNEEKSEVEGGKVSARTLSDIVSISEFDEQDLQMRRAELKAHSTSLHGPYPSDTRDKNVLNRTLPPELQRPNMSSLNIEYIDSDVPQCTPRADSLPAHLTSTQNRYKRNVNETTMFGLDKFGHSVKHSTAQNIPDNCSMYPNRDVSDNKHITVEPKLINFSVEPTNDNRTHDEEFASLRELGISLDFTQENLPEVLTQLKQEIKKSRAELENCKSELKNAEEQLCEFPALKEEVEELKSLLENTMATMETDKKFYENQLEIFSSNKKLLEQRMVELSQEVNEKTKDLHLLKEDILRRENMILELAKEKRNLTNKMAELEMKIDELQSRNNALENHESENRQMKERLLDLAKMEQLVSEKNHQIDSLNQHLDRLDDLQRCLNDKTEELDNLKEAFEEKSNELFQMQDTVEALNRDVARLTAENIEVNNSNKELKMRLSKTEKEQENTSLKLQNSEGELVRLNSVNGELTSKIDELKLMTDKLKDKETEIEILHEDINAFHEEIATLKEQLKMVSRSPSPKNKSLEEKRSAERPAGGDMKQLVKIRKQISLLQHELDFNRKELNDKAFELAKAKLDVTELKNNLGQAAKLAADKDIDLAQLRHEMELLHAEKQQLNEQLAALSDRLREESNVSELKAKLQERVERCRELEVELQDLKDVVDRTGDPAEAEADAEAEAEAEWSQALVVSGRRSPTADLERALRDQLHYSRTLDARMLRQILSNSSDEHEQVPRLALNTSRSSSSSSCGSPARLQRLRADNERLNVHLGQVELRLRDKDALIAELARIRDKLTSERESMQLKYEAERDNAGRLQLLLQTHQHTADSLQNQDSQMIQMLKKRLESAMQSEVELQQQVAELRARLALLERQPAGNGDAQLQLEVESSCRLRGEVSVLKAKLEVERVRASEAAAALQLLRARTDRELQAARDDCSRAHADLAELRRLKHDTGVELIRAKELLNIQSDTIAELEKKLIALNKQKPLNDALSEIASQKSELAREMAELKKCLSETRSPQAEGRLQRDTDQAVRYLHGRCLRLESCRKALVWQKRYLQRVLAGYHQLERTLPQPPQPPSRGRKKFRCVAVSVLVVLRMQFLVRRRHHVRALSARCLLRPTDNTHAVNSQTDASTPGGREGRTRDTQRPNVRHNITAPATPISGDFIRRPFNVNSPREEPFILSSPRGEASAYLSKLELINRCLPDRPRHAP